MVEVRSFTDPAALEKSAASLLRADPARATIFLTVLQGLILAPDPLCLPLLLVAFDGDRPVGVSLQTPPWPVTSLIDPHATDHAGIAAALGDAIAKFGSPQLISRFSGPRADAESVAGNWAAQTSTAVRPYEELLLYRLGNFVPAASVEGSGRLADPENPADLEVLIRWRRDFALAVNSPDVPVAGPGPTLRSMRSGVSMMLWHNDSGQPVAWAAHSPVVAGMSRIGPVYTPPEHRGHGYGSAVTAAAVLAARSHGAAEVVLFTDAGNPTSNAMYRRLGFEPIGEFVELLVDA